jgi:hypothetical protein
MSKEKIPGLDIVSVVPVALDPYKKSFFETKDNVSPTGHSLRAKVRMTYAGLKTKNRAVYLPDEHFRSAHTFLSPYPKPIQVHHDDYSDPIGRVIDVRYVNTTEQATLVDSRVKDVMKVFSQVGRMKDAVAEKKARLGTVSTFLDLSKNGAYKGVGHILGLWEVTDPDAIQKLLDGRYLTVSTGMMPQNAFCNVCAIEGELTDWAHDFCDHDRGTLYDGVECVAVPMNYEWEEVSPVNHPAAPLSQVIEVGHGLSFSDALQKTQEEKLTRQDGLFFDVCLVNRDKTRAISIRDGSNTALPSLITASRSPLAEAPPEAKHRQIPVDTQVLLHKNTVASKKDAVIVEKSIPTKEVTKTVAITLLSLSEDTNENYDAIAKLLDEDTARLTGDLLGELDNSVFIGADRTFPVPDKAHGEAIRQLLETVEDCEAKETLLTFLDERILTLEGDTQDEAEAPAEVEAVETEVKDSVEITAEELKRLTDLAERCKELELDRNLWKNRAVRLEDEVQALTAVHTQILKEQKDMLATSLLSAQEKRGFSIEDAEATLTDYRDRSVQSLKDSLADLDLKPVSGMAREPSGEAVADPRIKDSQETEVLVEEAIADNSQQYNGIIERYWNIYYGTGGEGAARNFLDTARRNKLIPETLQP